MDKNDAYNIEVPEISKEIDALISLKLVLSDKNVYMVHGIQRCNKSVDVENWGRKKDNIYYDVDCILDNRDELRIKLGQLKSDLSDEQLVMMAYEKWGSSFYSYIHGIYSMIIYDSKNNSVTLLTDPTGMRSLHFCNYHNMILYATIENTFSETYLDRQLQSESGGMIRVNAGEKIIITSKTMKRRQYYKGERMHSSHQYSFVEYRSMFHQIFDQKVRDIMEGSSVFMVHEHSPYLRYLQNRYTLTSNEDREVQGKGTYIIDHRKLTDQYQTILQMQCRDKSNSIGNSKMREKKKIKYEFKPEQLAELGAYYTEIGLNNSCTVRNLLYEREILEMIMTLPRTLYSLITRNQELRKQFMYFM